MGLNFHGQKPSLNVSTPPHTHTTKMYWVKTLVLLVQLFRKFSAADMVADIFFWADFGGCLPAGPQGFFLPARRQKAKIYRQQQAAKCKNIKAATAGIRQPAATVIKHSRSLFVFFVAVSPTGRTGKALNFNRRQLA